MYSGSSSIGTSPSGPVRKQRGAPAPGRATSGTAKCDVQVRVADAAGFESNTLSAAGAGGFTVGGTLSVPATIAAGIYTGSYSVTVNYN